MQCLTEILVLLKFGYRTLFVTLIAFLLPVNILLPHCDIQSEPITLSHFFLLGVYYCYKGLKRWLIP